MLRAHQHLGPGRAQPDLSSGSHAAVPCAPWLTGQRRGGTYLYDGTAVGARVGEADVRHATDRPASPATHGWLEHSTSLLSALLVSSLLVLSAGALVLPWRREPLASAAVWLPGVATQLLCLWLARRGRGQLAAHLYTWPSLMAVSLHPTDPAKVYCVTRGGQVFGTEDAGENWREYGLPSGVEDVYAVACV